ncbi:MAG: hypothetical protein FWC03_07230 [Treponema sp.]|nr:hypothetical protein [Treponema sp.]
MKFFSQRRIEHFVRGAENAKVCAVFVKRASNFVILALVASFLFLGCPGDDNHEDTGFVPVGEWSDDFGGSYTITASALEFDDGFGFTEFKGTIAAAVDFSQDAGVLIIKINSSETGITTNDYIGVYYKDYTSSHVFLANAIDVSFAIIEADTLNEAKQTFTVDNADTHVTYWGSGYTK